MIIMPFMNDMELTEIGMYQMMRQTPYLGSYVELLFGF